MADEARLHDLLDLVEQARAEGDKATEQKAIAAYKRESAPRGNVDSTPMPSMGGLMNPLTMRFANAANAIAANAPENISDIQSPARMAAAVPETALSLGTGLGTQIGGGIAGLASAPFVGMDRAADITRNIQGMAYQPRTLQGQTLTRGIGLPAEAMTYVGNKAGEKTAEVTGSPALGAGVNTALQAIPMILGARGVKPKSGEPYKPQAEVVPTKEALKQAAADAYRRSENIGAVVSGERFGSFQRQLSDAIQKNGLDSTLHPDATAAMKRIMSESGPMTLEKIETLRRIAQDAEGSIKPADARKAGEIVDAIDSMVENLKPEDLNAGTPEAAAAIKDARNYWSRSRKAEDLDELMRRAEISAPNFSASGMENAIRTEFRALAKNKRRLRKFTPEEQAAIEKVAKGGPIENAWRMLGKAAPTGVISGALGPAIGGGLGFLIGGPPGAAIGATAMPAFGALARLRAGKLTREAADFANELVRRGPKNSPTSLNIPKTMEVSGELMPREPLALPSPTIISGQRSAPGSMYQREQMGMTPDIERAGMLHPGVARQSIPQKPLALPYLPDKPSPLIVDQAGRVAPNAGIMQEYLRTFGLDRLNNVRQPAANPTPPTMPPEIAEALLGIKKPRGVREVRADLKRLEARARALSPDQQNDGAVLAGLSRDWDRLQAELAQIESRAKSGR